MLKFISSLLIAILVTSCASDYWFDGGENKKKAIGKRISVTSHEKQLVSSNRFYSLKIKPPAEQKNKIWPSSNIHTSNLIENFALGSALKESRTISIKNLTRKEYGPITPVIVKDYIFFVNNGTIYASDINSGKELWSHKCSTEQDREFAGGGLTFLDGVIYATAGYKEIMAIEMTSGKLKWKYTLPNVSKTAPSVSSNMVFAITDNNTIYAIDRHNGLLAWKHAGASESIGIVGAASPKALGNIVIVPYSSDQLMILDAKSGAELLESNFSKNDNFSQNFVFNDINITPLISGRNAYVINNDGVMISINLDNGATNWKQDVKGTKDMWIVGDFIYALTQLNEVYSIYLKTGEIRWNEKIGLAKKEIAYGPIVAGGRMIITTSKGKFIQLSLDSGKVLTENQVAQNLVFSPIVVDRKLYLIEKSGKLHIWQ